VCRLPGGGGSATLRLWEAADEEAEAGAGPRRWWWRRRPSGRAPGDPTRPPQVAADAVRPTARGLLRRRSGARGGAPAAAPTTPPARRPPSKPAPRLACYCSPCPSSSSAAPPLLRESDGELVGSRRGTSGGRAKELRRIVDYGLDTVGRVPQLGPQLKHS
jgi:hypothetical protein